jgi:hypothetical protein
MGNRLFDWLTDHVMPWFFSISFIGLIAILLLGAAFGLRYCALVQKEGHVVRGIVVEKHHSPSSTTYVQSGKVMVPVHNSESWSITVYGERSKSGRTDTESFSISEEQYAETAIGGKYP